MNNIKQISIITDGQAKRLAITFDSIDDSGKVIKANRKINRIVVEEDILYAINDIESYAESVIE
jgi:hypothetical protein